MVYRILFALIFCLSSAIAAYGDPLVLTNGSFSTFRSPDFWSNHGEASGPQVSFSGGSLFDCGGPGPCGDPSNAGFLSSLIRPNAGGGTLTLNGITYNAFTLTFSFNDSTITGVINVFADRDIPPGTPPLFSVNFIGFGFSSVFIDPQRVRTLTTQFTIVPVPEPGALVLIGLGISGLAIRLKTLRPKSNH